MEGVSIEPGFEFLCCLLAAISLYEGRCPAMLWTISPVALGKGHQCRLLLGGEGGWEEDVNGPYGTGRDHSLPLTGEMGGRTDQRCDVQSCLSTTTGDEVKPDPNPGRGVILHCGLGQDCQVSEGKARVVGSGLGSRNGSGSG